MSNPNLLLLAILLTMSGVPVLAIVGHAFALAALFGAMALVAIWKYLALVSVGYAGWRFAPALIPVGFVFGSVFGLALLSAPLFALDFAFVPQSMQVVVFVLAFLSVFVLVAWIIDRRGR